MKNFTKEINANNNYVLPMLWMRGESKEKIEFYLDKINQSGINSVTLESRPHDEFLLEGWWNDVENVLNKAQQLGMKVWFFDDAHFPTGGIANSINKSKEDLKKWYLDIKRVDVFGPIKNAKLITKYFVNHPFKGDKSLNHFDEIIYTVLLKRDKVSGTLSLDDAIILEPNNDFICIDIPDGTWSVFYIKKTKQGGEEQTKNHLDPLNPSAANELIDIVYKPHLTRFGEKYKETFAGFFSDEHRFGNVKGFEGRIGNKMVLPWSDEVKAHLKDSLGNDFIKLLPGLWYQSEKQEVIRFSFMEAVSNLYAKNFTGVLADWCKKNDLEYISHVIEDNGSHSRLGYGPGHYFKSLWPQSMAGIDVVLHQILPGFDDEVYAGFTDSGWDGEFFHYGLAKLGSSLGRIDEKKQGKSFCEVFGAYGWAEGVTLMKWLVDHMLVRGINHFMPHSFSMKEFPDWDCPPHLYADGKDPQFKFLPELMGYTQRLCHLSNITTASISIGVVYHAEAEWAGNYMPFQKVAKVLTRNQYDFDVLPSDYICKEKNIKSKYSTLIVPYSEFMQDELVYNLSDLASSGCNIIFIKDFPDKVIFSDGEMKAFRKRDEYFSTDIDDVVDIVSKFELPTINFTGNKKYLRASHRKNKEIEYWMITNEHPSNAIKGEVSFNSEHQPNAIYDPIRNELKCLSHSNYLCLEAYESVIYLYLENLNENSVEKMEMHSFELLETAEWNLSLSTAQNYPNFDEVLNMSSLNEANDYISMMNFSGIAKFETTFNLSEEDRKYSIIELGKLSECCELWVNDNYVGKSICPPHRFNITNAISIGINDLKVEVVTNLANSQLDFLSSFMPIEMCGLFGPINISK